jgi:hypothetical protein
MIVLLTACGKPKPLTAERAAAIVNTQSFSSEPVYAEVPQKVWWAANYPKDDYDEKAVRTLANLEKAGLITVAHSVADGKETYQAKVTDKGFRILGTMPSARGAVYRGRIAEKKFDGVRNFVRHPTDPTIGRAEIVWHYDKPTALYPLFETKIDKPLKTPFVSIAAFHWEKGSWRYELTVKKADASQ